MVPERPLAFFARNRDRLQAAIAVHRAADLEAACDLAALEDGLSRLTEDGTVAGDDELDRLTTAIDDLDAAASAAENVANDHLREAIREQDVTIEGSDLLSLVERGAGVDSLLSRELADEYARASRRPATTSSTRSISTRGKARSPAARSATSRRFRSSATRT